MTRLCNTKMKGFTLAEAMIAIVVLGIAASGILLPYTSGAAARQDGVNRTLAIKLASDLMEDIVSRPYNQIIPIYGNLIEAKGNMVDGWGTALSGPAYSKFSRQAHCIYIYTPQESGSVPAKMIRAEVQVNYDGTKIVLLERLISR